MVSSRFPGFYQATLSERRQLLIEQGVFTTEDVRDLDSGGLPLEIAEWMVENVVGLSALPLSVAPNFQINGKDYVVPMCIEEPSVVAAASMAARVVRDSGGFTAAADPSWSTVQIQLLDVPDTSAAAHLILEKKEEIVRIGNELLPSLVRRGGGVREVEVRVLVPSSKEKLGDLVVHVLLDCQDAMGANLSNTLAEGLSEMIAQWVFSKVGLCILSNLSDRRQVHVGCRIPVRLLKTKDFSGEEMRDRIVSASRFAQLDPYRAVTHNKGIMNGVDAVVLATGNDFRAVEAGAHAFAAVTGRYQPLSCWTVGEQGELVGSLHMPLALGIQGGTMRIRPSSKLALSMLRVESAGELASVAACVGLATNFAALRALGGHGIQQAHMPFHYRAQQMNHL